MIGKQDKSEKHSARAARATLWAGINTLIPMITSFGVLVVTSRILSPSQFGIVGLATGLALLGSAICPGGFGEAIIQRLELTPSHLNSVFWLCLGAGCAVFIVECAFAQAAAKLFKIASVAVLIPVISTRLISDMVGVVPNALIARSMSFHLFALRSLVVSSIGALITLALVFAGYGIWALVISQIMSSYIYAIASFLSVDWRPKWSFSLSALKELSGYGLYSSATLNVTSLVTQNEQILVGYFLGTTQLGLYNFSKRVIGVLNSVIAGSLGSVAHPMFSGIQNDTDRVRRGFLLATFVSSAIAFPIFAGLVTTADRIVPLIFGSHWLHAVPFVQIQCALGLIICISGLQSGLITSLGKADWWFYSQLLANVTTILVIAVFAQFGVKIMMIALVVRAYALWFIPVKMTLVLLSLKASEYFWNLRAPVVGTVLMLVCIYAERRMVGGGEAIGLVLDVGCGGTAYALGVLLVERQRVDELLRIILPKFIRPKHSV
jgi:O-antigen/teichoic acid export membrane protein